MDKEIIFEIDTKTGKVKAKTEGYTGSECIDELEDLLEEIAFIEEHNKTDDFYKEKKLGRTVDVQQKQKLGGSQ
ncbi:MAG: DUF2997 domain-containing protein [Candidatus Heimdallarchaeota archaeon]|nr:DUF2997 domain-containing protein [Candidatus Heimdallarchaeota archaeon]